VSDPSGKWRIAGTYYESCNCEAVCPCRRLNGKPGSRSSFRLCQFLLSWRVIEGHADGVDLAGRSVAMAGFYDSDEKNSPWTVSLYVDRSAGDAAFDALSGIFLGKRGGNILFTSNILHVIAVRRADIRLDHAKHRERISVREFASAEVEKGADYEGTVTCGIPGHDHPGEESVSRSRVADERLEWEYEGRCGFATDYVYYSQ
jgi:hypothetical protein